MRTLQFKQLQAEAEQAGRLEAAAKAVLKEAQRAAREGRSLKAAEISAIRTPILNPPTAEELATERKAAEEASQSYTLALRYRILSAQRYFSVRSIHARQSGRSELASRAQYGGLQARRVEQDRQKAEAAARADAAAAEARERAKEKAEAKKKEEDAAKAEKAAAEARAKKEKEEKVQAEKKRKEETAAKAEADKKAKVEAEAQARAQKEKELAAAKAKAEAEKKLKTKYQEEASFLSTKAVEEPKVWKCRTHTVWFDRVLNLTGLSCLMYHQGQASWPSNRSRPCRLLPPQRALCNRMQR